MSAVGLRQSTMKKGKKIKGGKTCYLRADPYECCRPEAEDYVGKPRVAGHRWVLVCVS